MSQPRFTVTRVSHQAYELMQDLEAAWCRFTATDNHDLQAVGDAYADLCQRRKELYRYLSNLELNVGFDRDVTLRFD